MRFTMTYLHNMYLLDQFQTRHHIGDVVETTHFRFVCRGCDGDGCDEETTDGIVEGDDASLDVCA